MQNLTSHKSVKHRGVSWLTGRQGHHKVLKQLSNMRAIGSYKTLLLSKGDLAARNSAKRNFLAPFVAVPVVIAVGNETQWAVVHEPCGEHPSDFPGNFY